jgi:hypothetical protein
MFLSFVENDGRPAAHIVIDIWHGHHENVSVTHKPAFSSLLPNHTLPQAFMMSLKKICVAKHKILCSDTVLQPLFSSAMNQESTGTNN